LEQKKFKILYPKFLNAKEFIEPFPCKFF